MRPSSASLSLLRTYAQAAALLHHTPLSEEQAELLGILEAGASHVVVIVDDILNLNEIETGRFKASERANKHAGRKESPRFLSLASLPAW